ncbi:MAG TPA: hypothetical protein DDW81_12530 [Cryomorphaceae bacterium]|nr:hypothetical protein [Owenweeksia sp.]HBF20919.1 hypothetical protein [Cryomorphaceae bacterium]HCQ14620.1 hypothetical protein [Cryomorphaceae bacterium]|tara:strand:+ start:239 stop:1864 length:1626 start_codon:yes stop_codon:yes gene_type:complete
MRRYMLIAFLSGFLSGQSQDQDEISKVAEWKGEVEHKLQSSPDSALTFLNSIVQSSLYRNDKSLQAWVAKRKGTLFMYIGDNERAISYYLQARELYEGIKDTLGLAGVYMNFGNVAGNVVEEIQNYRTSIKLYKEVNDSTGIARNLVNIGSVYLDNGELDSAEFYFKKSYELAADMKYGQVVRSSLLNLGTVMASKGELEKGIQNLKKALKLYKESDELMGVVFGNYHLGRFMMESGFMDSCRYYITQTLNASQGSLPRIEMYSHELLYVVALELKNYEEAYRQLMVRDSIRDVLDMEGKQELFKRMKAEYDVQTQERKIEELQLSAEKDFFLKLLYLGVFVLIAALALYLYFSLKDKRRKARELLKQDRKYKASRQKLLESELENTRLEQQTLQERLKIQKKSLAEFALTFVQNDEIFNKVKSGFGNIEKKGSQSAQLKEVSGWLGKLEEQSGDREEFLRKSEQLTEGFLEDLLAQLPELTQKEVQLLLLIMLKLSYKEIAVLMGIKPASVNMKRYHLRKKLGLGKGESFEFFIREKLYG